MIRSNVNPLTFPQLFTAGRAVLTFHNPETDNHVTIKVKQWKKRNEEGKLEKLPKFTISISLLGDKEQGMLLGGYFFQDENKFRLGKGVDATSQLGDERRALDEIMTRLRTLVQETGVSMIVVSHLRRPEGKGHEEGAATSLSQLRGSASIGQLSDMVIGLERDAQNDDPDIRNTTRIRVLKNRFSGITGPCCDLKYDIDTGRLTEVKSDDF